MIRILACLSLLLFAVRDCHAAESAGGSIVRIGIIGLDTSHSPNFTRMINDIDHPNHVAGCKVVAAYPKGSEDIESSVSRIAGYTEDVREMGVKIVGSIDELLPMVDAILLETNDGRPRLAQARKVIAAGKPMFIDKPIAGSLADTVSIIREARAADVPIFSASSLRFVPGLLAIRDGSIGNVLGCSAYGPEKREPHHPSLFWYGIHGTEILFTAMGPGCQSVTRIESDQADVVVGRWQDGRIGTFRGIREDGTNRGRGSYGATVFASEGISQIGSPAGYQPLVEKIARFFSDHVAPVPLIETIEIYAFMEAADESTRQGGTPVSIAAVLKKAGADQEFLDSLITE